MPPTFAACVATPDTVLRRYAERVEAGQTTPGEQAPAPLYRSIMLRALPDISASIDGAQDIREDDGPERYPFVMSAVTPDRSADIVEQDWDLSAFQQNPIGPYNHNTWSFPVGRWMNVRVEAGMLMGDFVPTPVEGHQDAIIVAGLLKAGTLRAASVGFIPSTVTERSKFPTAHAYYAERGYVYGRPKLLECSIVNVPMHPDATAQRAAEPPPVAPAPPPTPEADPVAKAPAPPPVAEADTFDLDKMSSAFASLFPTFVS
jgi:hypothetical protein